VRAVRFLLAVLAVRRTGIRLTRHNLRALWLQTAADWDYRGYLGLQELSDEEFDAFIESCRGHR
jgi:hypothetical protein